MTFRTHTEEHQVETGQLIRFQSETPAQIIRILRGCFHRVRFLTLDAMHLLCIHWDFREQRLRSHPKITFGVIGTHMPFIAKKPLNLAPGDERLQQRVVYEQTVEHVWHGAASERDVEGALLLNSLPRGFHEFCGGGLRDAIGIRPDHDFPLAGQSLSAHFTSSPQRFHLGPAGFSRCPPN
jgi:hypothetical protein